MSGISGESKAFRVDRRMVRWIVLLYLIFPYSLYSQVFPLKIGKENCFLTRKDTPLFLNAIPIELLTRTEEIDNTLLRLSYLGINAVVVSIDIVDPVFHENGSPSKALKRKIQALRRLSRLARFRNMTVMVSLREALPSSPEKTRKQFHSFLFHRLYHVPNVIWIPDRDMPARSDINPRQLEGTAEDEYNSDFRIISDPDALNAAPSKPVLFCISGDSSGDSIRHLNRVKTYAAILKGASGIMIIPEPRQTKPYPFTPFAGQNELMKSVFDTCRKYGLKTFPALTGTEYSSKRNVVSSMNQDSSVALVYIPYSAVFPLDLRFFGNRILLTWIDVSSGKTYPSEASGKPDIQLFTPPLADDKFTDWLLMIRRDPAHSSRTGY